MGIEYKFIEWSKKNINVAIRHKYYYNPDVTKYYACINIRGKNNRSVNEEDMKDTWEEAYQDAELKISKLR